MFGANFIVTNELSIRNNPISIDSKCFFAYEDGDLSCNVNFKRATEFSKEIDVVKAMSYAQKRHYDAIPVLVKLDIQVEQINTEDIIRKSALSKLNDVEKKVLGLL